MCHGDFRCSVWPRLWLHKANGNSDGPWKTDGLPTVKAAACLDLLTVFGCCISATCLVRSRLSGRRGIPRNSRPQSPWEWCPSHHPPHVKISLGVSPSLSWSEHQVAVSTKMDYLHALCWLCSESVGHFQAWDEPGLSLCWGLRHSVNNSILNCSRCVVSWRHYHSSLGNVIA